MLEQSLDNPYSRMQRGYYDGEATAHFHVWRAGFDEHNDWKPYLWLVEPFQGKVALDFGCGIGRNLVKYGDWFERMDGVDISAPALDRAAEYAREHGLSPRLYHSNGVDLSEVPSGEYDLVHSTIVLQHIAVYDIRKSLLSEFFRVLKPGGSVAAQMGYGTPSPQTVGYFENFWDAPGTNRACDVAIDHPLQVGNDLLEIGFSDFEYVIGRCGPMDMHPQWIYFRARKPS